MDKLGKKRTGSDVYTSSDDQVLEDIQEHSAKMCGQNCPTCKKPCRGFKDHAGQHQCNQHHSW